MTLTRMNIVVGLALLLTAVWVASALAPKAASAEEQEFQGTIVWIVKPTMFRCDESNYSGTGCCSVH